jgi:hypothetical protein
MKHRCDTFSPTYTASNSNFSESNWQTSLALRFSAATRRTAHLGIIDRADAGIE